MKSECLVIAANKGGVGKTTLSALLASKASQMYESVYIIDLDPQKSLEAWWKKRKDDSINLLDVFHTQLKLAREKVKNKNAFVIIDTPPAHINIIEAP